MPGLVPTSATGRHGQTASTLNCELPCWSLLARLTHDENLTDAPGIQVSCEGLNPRIHRWTREDLGRGDFTEQFAGLSQCLFAFVTNRLSGLGQAGIDEQPLQ